MKLLMSSSEIKSSSVYRSANKQVFPLLQMLENCHSKGLRMEGYSITEGSEEPDGVSSDTILEAGDFKVKILLKIFENVQLYFSMGANEMLSRIAVPSEGLLGVIGDPLKTKNFGILRCKEGQKREILTYDSGLKNFVKDEKDYYNFGKKMMEYYNFPVLCFAYNDMNTLVEVLRVAKKDI